VDLRKRLAELDRLTRRPEANQSPDLPVDPEQIAEILIGRGMELQRVPAGSIWVREVVDAVAPPSALTPFFGFFTHADEADPGVEDLLFLDTETTGLAGGTGTLAFLVGASWWSKNRFVTRQYFMASPGQEPAMLAALNALAERFAVVVTFNGASFDLPLLRTRALMNRFDDPLANLISWDLLVPARRLWARKLENCRQQTLESAVCDLPAREGDIDGSQIPAVWFEFLANGQTERLDQVMVHNRLDMLGMAHLFRKVTAMASLVLGGEQGAVEDADWRDFWSLGRICERMQEQQSAGSWMRRAFLHARNDSGSPPDARFLADAIRIVKRTGDWREVEGMIAWGLNGLPPSPWLHREAAMLYERRLPDLENALAHALLCGEDGRLERVKRKLAARDTEVSD
jgi:uncharacterized protein